MNKMDKNKDNKVTEKIDLNENKELERGLNNPVEIDSQTDPEQTESKTTQRIFGEIIDTQKLNVRKTPSLKADVECVIENPCEMEVIMDESTEDFYSVVLSSGVHGYCLKKYVQVKK